MSKISLDLIKTLLTTEEMKKVTGGSGSGSGECEGNAFTCWCNGRNIGTASSRECCDGRCAACTWCE